MPTCRKCGTPLATTALGGLCPRCVAVAALATDEALPVPPDVEPGAAEPRRVRYFGDYELLEEIAHGGMGVVWKARQVSLNRTVAVKMILRGALATEADVQRFRAEAEAAANLRHPNIVAIYEIGQDDGQHYFAMEYVAGRNLSQIVREHPLSLRKAAEYVRAIAEAIQHAHEQGTLHRDLKPSNVIIDDRDQPHVTDFGLAKRLGGDSDLTLSGQVLGTPSFMSPEQAAGRRKDIGPASDIYSLGAILYHLLTGRPPFSAEAIDETLRQVMEVEPASPRLLNANTPRDLETICLKCLAKEPHRRYASARELADDLNRFLRGESIHARPVTRAEKLWHWCRREPALASLAAGVALLLVTIAIGSTLAAFRINTARGNESRERQRAENVLARLRIDRAEDLFQSGDASAALAELAWVLRNDPSNRIAAERLIAALSQRNFPILAVPPLTFKGIGALRSAQFSPDGRRVLTGSYSGAAAVWHAETGRLLHIIDHHSNSMVTAFAPESARVVVGSTSGDARIFEAETGQPRLSRSLMAFHHSFEHRPHTSRTRMDQPGYCPVM